MDIEEEEVIEVEIQDIKNEGIDEDMFLPLEYSVETNIHARDVNKPEGYYLNRRGFREHSISSSNKISSYSFFNYVEEIPGPKVGSHLYKELDTEHLFSLSKYFRDRGYFNCANRMCSAKLICSSNSKQNVNHHNHDSSLQRINELLLRHRCRERAMETDLPIRQIYDEEIVRFIDEPPDIVYSKLESVMYKSRRRSRVTDYQSMEDLQIEEPQTKRKRSLKGVTLRNGELSWDPGCNLAFSPGLFKLGKGRTIPRKRCKDEEKYQTTTACMGRNSKKSSKKKMKKCNKKFKTTSTNDVDDLMLSIIEQNKRRKEIKDEPLYCRSWELEQHFQDWLFCVPQQETKAQCLVCNEVMVARFNAVALHSKTSAHQDKMNDFYNNATTNDEDNDTLVESSFDGEVNVETVDDHGKEEIIEDSLIVSIEKKEFEMSFEGEVNVDYDQSNKEVIIDDSVIMTVKKKGKSKFSKWSRMQDTKPKKKLKRHVVEVVASSSDSDDETRAEYYENNKNSYERNDMNYKFRKHIEEIPGSRIGTRLYRELDNSYIFACNKYLRGRGYFKCVERFCRAKLICSRRSKLKIQYHSHEPSHLKINELLLRQRCKQRAQESHQNLRIIFEEEIERFDDDVPYITFDMVESTMYKCRTRAQQLPPIPETVEQLANNIASTGHKLSWNVEEFYRSYLCADDESDIIVFASPTLLEPLQAATTLYIDATYTIVPQYPHFHQLLTIHFDSMDYSFPVFYCLMTSNSQAAYYTLFAFIREICPNLAVEVIMITDYDCALQNVIVDIFSEADIVLFLGCYFHFTQNLYKTICSPEINLKKLYNERTTTEGVLIRSTFALPLLAPEEALDGLVQLEENCRRLREGPVKDKITRYLLYIRNYWVNIVGVEAWSVFGIPRRTNNSLEMLSLRLKEYIGDCHENIWSFIDRLKLYDKRETGQFQLTIQGKGLTRRRKNKYVTNDVKLQKLRSKLDNNRINILEFLSESARRLFVAQLVNNYDVEGQY